MRFSLRASKNLTPLPPFPKREWGLGSSPKPKCTLQIGMRFTLLGNVLTRVGARRDAPWWLATDLYISNNGCTVSWALFDTIFYTTGW